MVEHVVILVSFSSFCELFRPSIRDVDPVIRLTCPIIQLNDWRLMKDSAHLSISSSRFSLLKYGQNSQTLVNQNQGRRKHPVMNSAYKNTVSAHSKAPSKEKTFKFYKDSAIHPSCDRTGDVITGPSDSDMFSQAERRFGSGSISLLASFWACCNGSRSLSTVTA